MPKVALVYPYFRTRSATELLFPPLGAASLASQLRRLGIEAKIFDCTFRTPGQVRKDLAAYAPEVVGVYCMITLSRNAFRIAETIRRDLPDSLLVAGGPLPTLYPERFSGAFDVVFRGESDLSFPSFCRDFFDADRQLSNLTLQRFPGLYLNQAGLRLDNPQVHYIEKELEAFPLPDRIDFDHAAYQKVWQSLDGSKTTSIITTLGCPFSCDFCSRPIFGSLFRRRNLDAVFEEVAQVRSLGYDSLWIADDNFTLDLAYLRRFCERMASEKMRWSCLSRVSGLDEEITHLMKEAGCRRVYLGLETGEQETLNLMNKRTTVSEGVEAVHLFRKAGIEAAAFFIVGYPGETIDSIESTFKLALSLPLNYISFNVPFPLPGSKLSERVSNIDRDKDWNTENEVTFVYSSEFDPRWLRQRIRQTMQAFAARQS
jgi:radical SAM superfamily enzyme YgiQ (UPF0313 family)